MSDLKVGDVIHGFAAGAFGRDSYYCRVVEAVGRGWIVTRNSVGRAEFTTYLYFDPDDRGYCDEYCPYREDGDEIGQTGNE